MMRRLFIIKTKIGNTQYIVIISLLLLNLGIMLYPMMERPKNSIDLYYHIKRSDDYADIQKILRDKQEHQLPLEQYEKIKADHPGPDKIRQLTILEYTSSPLLIETTPGTNKLEIICTEELPKEFATFLRELDKE